MNSADHLPLGRYIIVLAMCWTLVIAGYAFWGVHQDIQNTKDLATSQARANIHKDTALRLWATQHGRIYIPIGEKYTPDPHLAHIPDRDIETPGGIQLSMINPARIIRQLHQDFDYLYSVSGRVTSLKPLAQVNSPDTWEKSALEKLARGQEEVFEFTDIENEPYLRLMQPLKIQVGCLLCHNYQDQKVGDVGGGIGVNLPMTALLKRQEEEITAEITAYFFIWLVGVGGLAVSYRSLGRQRDTLKHTVDALHQSEKRKTAIMESALDSIITINKQGRIVEFNPAAERTFGYKRETIVGREMADLLIPSSLREKHHRGFSRHILDGSSKILDNRIETTAMRANGSEFPVELTICRIDVEEDTFFTAYLRDITEASYMTEQLSYQATHDSLTGVLNRHTFEKHLKAAIETSDENDQSFLLYLDLDQFKVINRSSGHSAGDELLRQFTVLLQMQIDRDDFLARLGGDEFGILIRQATQNQANEVALNILKALRQFCFYWQKKSYTIGASIGLVAVTGDWVSATELINAGDAACAKAKEDGRDRTYLYSPEDENLKQHQSELEWINQIQQALGEGRFQLLRQAITPLRSRKHQIEQHYEILIRMVADKGEIITPDQFIPAAEHYNLMPTIDRFVIEQVFNWVSGINKEKQQKILYSINLSGLTIADTDTQQFVKNLFNKYNVLPSSICFEITETVAITNLNKARVFIDRLRKLGCHFALDDFGSGMSSYGYLKNLPVDFLKIDSEFVRDMTSNTVSLAMVRSIHEIGQLMGISTIAEYVEDMATVAMLREIGVDYAQGFYFSKPEPMPEIAASSR